MLTPQSGACARAAEMAVPVEQLEISIPQGDGLFIETIFQARSFREPLALLFQVQIEYLVSLPRSPPPVVSPLYLDMGTASHPWRIVPIPRVEMKPLSVRGHLNHLYGF